MKAVILAGGSGTRLRPLTSNRPKPMIPLLNFPVMEHSIRLLKKYGVSEIFVTLFYRPEIVSNYFGTGSQLGVKIHYSIEDEPLGTCGGLAKIRRFLKDDFIVIPGDCITDINFENLLKFHRKKKAVATIALRTLKSTRDYGIVIVNKSGSILKFLEKPMAHQKFSNTVNTGIYCLSPRIFKFIPKGKNFDFSLNLFPLLIEKKIPFFGFRENFYWRDIGNLEQYRKVNYDILNELVDIEVPGRKHAKGLWIGKNVKIDEDVQLIPPVFIGDNSQIQKKSKISMSVIGNNCFIGENVSIKRGVIFTNSYIENSCEIDAAVIGKRCLLEAGSRILENSVVADDSFIGRKSVVNVNVRIWPNKNIPQESVVSENVIWGMTRRRQLFRGASIEGPADIFLTPSFVARLGRGFATIFDVGSHIAVSRDSSRVSRMLKRAFISGLMCSGINVFNLRLCAEPILSHFVKNSSSSAGVHFKTGVVGQNVVIEFLDRNGVHIDGKVANAFEQLVTRGDHRRVNIERMGEIIYSQNVRENYKRKVLDSVKDSVLPSARGKTIFVKAPLFTLGILNELFADLGIRSILQTGGEKFSRIIALNADCGVEISDDCRKVVLYDETGSALSGEVLLSMWIEKFSNFRKRSKVILPIDIGLGAVRALKRKRLFPIFAACRGSDVLRKSLEEKAVFAYFDDCYCVSSFTSVFDGIFFAVQSAVSLLSSGEKISTMARVYKRERGFERRIRLKTSSATEMYARFSEIYGNRKQTVFLDGIRLSKKDVVVVIKPPEFGVIEIVVKGDKEKVIKEIAKIEKMLKRL